MLEPLSALDAVYKVGRFGVAEGPASVIVKERRAGRLVQVSAWPDSFAAVCQKLQAMLNFPMPSDGLRCRSESGRSAFRVAPERLWLVGPADDEILGQIDDSLFGDQAVVTEIDHSRTVLRLSGPNAKVVLSRGLPIDLDDEAFPPGAFAQSVIHHIPVLVHRVEASGDAAFDLYVTRDYAVTFWEWVIWAAEPLGVEVVAAIR
jgi:sarcosine oxidase subunit gamma